MVSWLVPHSYYARTTATGALSMCTANIFDISCGGRRYCSRSTEVRV